MRYYAPTILSFLSPAFILFHLISFSEGSSVLKAIAGVLPDVITSVFGGKEELQELLNTVCGYYLLFQLATVAAVVVSMPIVNIVFAAKRKFKPKTISILNLLVKLLTIPMYAMLVFAPIIAIIGSVWGMGIALAIVVLTAAAVIVTALFSIPAAISGARSGKIGKVGAFFMAFLSFIPVVDIAMAIAMTVLSGKKNVTAPPPIVQAQ